MKNWKFIFCLTLFIFWGIFLKVNAQEIEREIARKNLQDAFIIAMEDDDGDRDLDREDDDRIDDDDRDDDDWEREKDLPVPRNMEELWRYTFAEVDELNAEQTKKFYQENFPFIIEQAERMLKNEPREVVHFLENELDQFEHMLAVKRENPQRFEAWVKYKKNEFHSMELAEKIRNLSRKEKPTAKEQQEIKVKTEELRNILGALFELRLQHQKNEIKHLRREVKNVEAQIKRREKNRDRIIQKKLDQMTGKEEDLEW